VCFEFALFISTGSFSTVPWVMLREPGPRRWPANGAARPEVAATEHSAGRKSEISRTASIAEPSHPTSIGLAHATLIGQPSEVAAFAGEVAPIRIEAEAFDDHRS
jgi:hypothetical protein